MAKKYLIFTDFNFITFNFKYFTITEMPISLINTPHDTLPCLPCPAASTRLRESVPTASRLFLHPYVMRTRGTSVCVLIVHAADDTGRKRERI